MENEFKKQDANGNKLTEEIGKGGNEPHIEKVLREVIYDETISFKIQGKLKEEFKSLCPNQTELLRAFVSGYVSQKKNKTKKA